jgi:hypothetical protein
MPRATPGALNLVRVSGFEPLADFQPNLRSLQLYVRSVVASHLPRSTASALIAVLYVAVIKASLSKLRLITQSKQSQVMNNDALTSPMAIPKVVNAEP